MFSEPGKAAEPLAEARRMFLEMLHLAEQLWSEVQPCQGPAGVSEERLAEARSADKNSNKLERSMRKLLVEHLAFNSQDAAPCLILMSVGKDGERVVDLCRDYLSLGLLLKGSLDDNFATDIQAAELIIAKELQRTQKAFAEHLEADALAIVEEEKAFIAQLHNIEIRLLNSSELSVQQVVMVDRALMNLSRIRAHLANIASTVVFPLHRIDFAKRSFVRDAKRDIQP